jgi:flagellar motor protein MotB
MADGNNAPIIVKKIKKGGHGGHHGGAWKVAYADFVTAMMAFFLLLWLLNATTDEQKQGIADYFSPASLSRQTSGSGGVMGGSTMAPDGALTDQRAPVGLTVSIPSAITERDDHGETEGQPNEALEEESIDEALAKREDEQFAAAEQALRQAIRDVPELQQLAQNLLIDRTPEGMRIQIVDQAGKSMFPLGRSNRAAYAPGRGSDWRHAATNRHQGAYRCGALCLEQRILQLGTLDRPGQREPASLGGRGLVARPHRLGLGTRRPGAADPRAAFRRAKPPYLGHPTARGAKGRSIPRITGPLAPPTRPAYLSRQAPAKGG